jgi:hypothetical protein
MSKIFEALSEQHHEAPVSTLPAVSPSADDGWADAAAESASNLIRGTLLKFADWRWTKGAEKTEVSIGTQFVAIGTVAAWVCWQDGKPDSDKSIVRQPGKPLPDRRDLGDLDQGLWEKGPDGITPKDPWQSMRYVYLLDPVSIEMLTFSTSSGGGTSAVRVLADQIQRMRDYSKSNALPVVEIGAAEMPTKFGLKSKPTFKIVRWYRGDHGWPFHMPGDQYGDLS